jgi:hypothetical protein
MAARAGVALKVGGMLLDCQRGRLERLQPGGVCYRLEVTDDASLVFSRLTPVPDIEVE